MVLSNKKLKQKLRSNLAESLTASMAETHPSNNGSTTPDPNSKTHSLKQLMDSETQKPRLTKREKRRKAIPLLGSDVVNRSSKGEENKEDKIESLGHEENDEKKNKRKRDGDVVVENGGTGLMESAEAAKKRKRDGVIEKGGAGSMEGVEAAKKKSKTKKKKKKKKKQKGKMDDEKKGDEVGNGDQGMTEAVKINDSQANLDVASKIYAGGIPYYSTEDDIRSYFEGCGTITEIDCMTFPESGKFRGIAIISFKTEAAAKRALAFDGSDMGGLFLKVQPYKTTRDNKASDFSPEIVEGYNRIYIGNLSWDITEEDLKKFFSDCKISSVRFGKDKETGEFRGYGHVDFSDSLSLTMALKLDQQIVCGRPVKIRCAVPKKVGESKKADTKKEGEGKKIDTMKEGESKMADGDGTMISGGGKIKRRTCYECGEKGHVSSACPVKKLADLTNQKADTEEGESRNADTMKEGESKTADGDGTMISGSGKIKRRTYYECGEKGHLSSDCHVEKLADLTNLKVDTKNEGESKKVYTMKEGESKNANTMKEGESKADGNGTMIPGSGKIKRRTCYECGEKGHLSSACPKKNPADLTDPNAS